jgi:hypothetical protein
MKQNPMSDSVFILHHRDFSFDLLLSPSLLLPTFSSQDILPGEHLNLKKQAHPVLTTALTSEMRRSDEHASVQGPITSHTDGTPSKLSLLHQPDDPCYKVSFFRKA